ncbi:amidase [Sphingomonas sp. ERG5]|uniref:amidase n=1 Tax=Sphingomonas sp. ERG5 TaxID=1381597 RepID=UPI00054BC058|nr:amidase [Sphingomonas sp. ERG5]
MFVTPCPPTTSEGLRVAVKDVLDMRGEVTTCGSRALAATAPAKDDAEVVRRLRTAGCALVGRTSLHELAYGVTGVNAWSGTPINPYYPQLIPGGSSSGSAAAVAAGLVDFAIGTDTGGSIRLPAACCGVVGLKPTFGRVSRVGAVPAQSSLDCVGPFARSVAMIEQAMAIIAPDWFTFAPPSARVGWVDAQSDPALSRRLRQVVGRYFEAVPLPLTGLADAMDAGLTIIGRETFAAFGKLLQSNLLGLDVHQRLSRAAEITDEDIAQAEGVRARFTAQVDAALEHVEALAMPALPRIPPTLHEAADPAQVVQLTANCRPFNLSGHPALVLPMGEHQGRPIALQLVGRRGEDERLCALARDIDLFLPETINDR